MSASSSSASAAAAPETSAPASPRFRVYTKTGDKGSTSLYTGERRPKTDPVFEALGDVDELNSQIGLAREHCDADANGISAYLDEIQSRLLDVGSHIATPLSSANQQKLGISTAMFSLLLSRFSSNL
jgi:ATP:cob(I)alamin adenosyltransferase